MLRDRVLDEVAACAQSIVAAPETPSGPFTTTDVDVDVLCRPAAGWPAL